MSVRRDRYGVVFFSVSFVEYSIEGDVPVQVSRISKKDKDLTRVYLPGTNVDLVFQSAMDKQRKHEKQAAEAVEEKKLAALPYQDTSVPESIARPLMSQTVQQVTSEHRTLEPGPYEPFRPVNSFGQLIQPPSALGPWTNPPQPFNTLPAPVPPIPQHGMTFEPTQPPYFAGPTQPMAPPQPGSTPFYPYERPW